MNTLPSFSTETQHCPQCNATIPIIPLYVTWCHVCNWNVQPQQVNQPGNTFARIYLRLGEYAGQQLSNTLAKESRQGHFSVARSLAFGIALLVHITTLLFVIAGILLIGWSNHNVFVIVLGVLCLGFALLARPRFLPMPQQQAPTTQFPTLHAITERVARELGMRQLPIITITSEFNASFLEAGIRRKPVVRLGLPLFVVLSPQERVALIAHELAHGVNNDPRRGFFVGSAVDALAHWHAIFQPDAMNRNTARHANGTVAGCFGFFGNNIANVWMRLLGLIPWCGLLLLSHLLWRDSQRAEYLADALAAKVSGTAGMLGALEKMHYGEAVHHSVQRLVLGVPAHLVHKQPLIDVLRSDIAMLPERERERIKRIEMHDGSRLDATHPPTPYRIRALEHCTVAAPAVIITPEEQVQIDCELRRVESSVVRALSDSYRRSLYY